MQYGSGNYEMPRNYTSSPVPRVRPEATGIAEKHRGSAMYTCLNHPKNSTFGSQKAQSTDLENGPMRHAGVRSPILVDPVYNGGKYSNRSARPVPRVRPEAAEVAEKSKGCMGMLMGNYGKPDPYEYQYSRDENIDPRKGPMRQAGVKGPILVDPVYTKGQYSDRTPRPAPRVRPEAEEIATRSKGTVGKLFVTEERRYDEYTKPKKGPKDHGNENVKRMRRIQREARARESQKNTPVKAMWKSSQYDGVESRVKEFMQDPPRAPRPENPPERPHSAPARSNRVNGNEFRSREPLKPQQSMTPRQVKKPIDFVARNARVARSYELRRSKSQMAVQESTQKYNDGLKKYNVAVRGKTPTYLQSRQKQWTQEERERIRNMPDPTVPEGHTVLPDSERRETLSTLQSTMVTYSVITDDKHQHIDSDYEQYFNDLPASQNRPPYYPTQYRENRVNGQLMHHSSYPAEIRTQVEHFPHPPGCSKPELQPYFGHGHNGDFYEHGHIEDDAYDTTFDPDELYTKPPQELYHQKYENSNPLVNIKAKNGSPVYVYAPQSITNINKKSIPASYTQNTPAFPMHNLSLDDQYQTEQPNGFQNYETNAENDYHIQEPQFRKSVSFRSPVASVQNSMTPVPHSDEYSQTSYVSHRMPTAYRDAYENHRESNENSWNNTDYYPSAQPTLWEYETGKRNWNDGSWR